MLHIFFLVCYVLFISNRIVIHQNIKCSCFAAESNILCQLDLNRLAVDLVMNLNCAKFSPIVAHLRRL